MLLYYHEQAGKFALQFEEQFLLFVVLTFHIYWLLE